MNFNKTVWDEFPELAKHLAFYRHSENIKSYVNVEVIRHNYSVLGTLEILYYIEQLRQ